VEHKRNKFFQLWQLDDADGSDMGVKNGLSRVAGKAAMTIH